MSIELSEKLGVLRVTAEQRQFLDMRAAESGTIAGILRSYIDADMAVSGFDINKATSAGIDFNAEPDIQERMAAAEFPGWMIANRLERKGKYLVGPKMWATVKTGRSNSVVVSIRYMGGKK